MSHDNTIIGLDVGTCNTRFVVAQINDEEKKIKILGVGQALSTGMRKGVVVDLEETIRVINQAKEMAERISGCPIDRAYIGVNGNHISCKPNKGVVAVSRADGEISAEDVERTINAASAICLLQNREILHVLPRYFIVDNQDKIKDPVGMSGIRLEVEALLIEGATPFIKNLTKCVVRTGVEIDGLILTSLASAQAVLSNRQKELGVLSLDIGGSTTGLTVFEEGDIIHTQVLPIGSSHITNDIALGLRIPVDAAEKIKIEYGSVLPEEFSKKDTIDLSTIEGGGEGFVTKQHLAEIIEARMSEIFDFVDKELKRIDRQGLLPAGVVLTGGGAKMPGLVDFTKNKLRLPAQIGFPVALEGIVDQVDDPCFATVVGLALWGVNRQKKFNKLNILNISSNKRVVRLVKWFRRFLP